MAEREPLSRDRIVAGGVHLADADGIDGLTMRKLAAELGYEPMSLYNYVDSKDDLVAGMVDTVIGAMTLPGATGVGDWRGAMHAALVSARDVLLAHPWASALWNQTWPGPNRKAWMDGLLGCLRGAGFSVELAHHGYHAVDLYVVGTVQQQLSFNMPDDLDAAATMFLDQTPTDAFPHLVEHVHYHLDEDTMDEDDFDVLLDFILDGLERRAAAS